ncbi:MAG: hypothetical protein AB7S48_00880 [Bacteroidales bacterium]
MKNLILKVVLVALMIFIVINNFYFFPGNILSWDVFGYYLYLPLKFIYHDLGLSNDTIVHSIIEKYHNTGTFYQAMKMPDGHYVMKYSMGLSVLYSPFFFIGHLLAKMLNYPADGFSLPYQYSIFIGGIVYSITGLIVLAKVLMHFFSKVIASLVLIIIVLSTNYIVHITMYGQNAMSHNYLFFAYSLILWITILWHKSHKIKHIILLAIVCGVTILSRPSEIVCLLIPFFWGIYNKSTAIEKKNLLVKYKGQIITFILIVFLIGIPQFVYWKIYAGKFLFNSYGGNAGEGFEFLRPYILQVLFSFRKGWLIYTPVMIFGIIGFVFLYRKNRTIFYALFVYFIANLFIVSSWSCWWYANSFSQRALIPSYPVMAIAIGYFLSWMKDQKRIVIAIGCCLIIGCTSLNIFQIVQFHNGIIDGDRMTREYYFAVFGKMHATEDDKKLLLINRSVISAEPFNNQDDYSARLLNRLDFENSEKKDSTVAHSAKYSFKMDSSLIYSPCIESPYYDLTNKDHAWVRATVYIYPVKDIKSNPFSLVVNFSHNNYSYKYRTFDSENMNLELNKWNKITFDYLTPEVRRNTDNLVVYVWLRGNETLYIDDLQVEVFEKK